MFYKIVSITSDSLLDKNKPSSYSHFGPSSPFVLCLNFNSNLFFPPKPQMYIFTIPQEYLSLSKVLNEVLKL